MKHVSFTPEGRKLTTVRWRSETRATDPAVRGGGAQGPMATIDIRFVEKDHTFNGRVDNTTVYAEGDSVKAVVADCERQLDALHAADWQEKLWLRLTPDELMDGTGFTATRVRLAVAPHGAIWQRWGRPGKTGPEEWRETQLGTPPVGEVRPEYGSMFYAALVPVTVGVPAAVATVNHKLAAARAMIQGAFTDLMGEVYRDPAAGTQYLVTRADAFVQDALRAALEALTEAAALPPAE